MKLLSSLKSESKTEQIQIVDIPSINSIQQYSKFMVNDLVNYVDTNFALCTQWDAFVLNPNAWTPEFLDYDYIGAPWWFDDAKNVGNGGFSLRSKKFLGVSSFLGLKNFHPEDLTLCRVYRGLLESKGIKFAPEVLASRFSLEGNAKYGQQWTTQFGFHDLEMTDIRAWDGYNDFIKEK